jgi:hypothetical protein
MFCERTVCVDANHIYTGIFFQFLGTNRPVQNPSRNGVQYFNFNVETEPEGILKGGGSRGGGRRTSLRYQRIYSRFLH